MIAIFIGVMTVAAFSVGIVCDAWIERRRARRVNTQWWIERIGGGR